MRGLARMREKQWEIYPVDERASVLAKALKVSPIFAQVLINRQIKTVEQGQAFINPRLCALIEPERMPDVAGAVERIARAITNKEKISIYGDYDVDGITGTAILWYMLVLLNAEVDYYIPHRIDEGYGMNCDAVKQLAEQGTKLIITVDCGITALRSAELASELGMDLIITDHHQPHGKLPEAVAIVHPGLEGYDNPDSSGAMVAFKLAWALANNFHSPGKLEPRLREFLMDATMFAAMGTVADVVDLRGENRVITSYGLKALSRCKLPGIQALIDSAGLVGKDLDSYHIGFRLAPMLNAAGRMGHARLAVELLTSDNEVRSMRIAQYLKEQNNQRRQCERRIFKQAFEKIVSQGLDHPDRKTIVLADDDWHTGVIGIVASRIIDKYYRPTILINGGDGLAHGSGRSVAGFDILKAITACSQHLADFGGHSMAAGITIEKENIALFAADFESYAQQHLKQAEATPKLAIDAVGSIAQFKANVVKEMELLGPFGQGNPRPMFATKGVRLIAPPRKVGVRGEHLQLTISDNTAAVRCIGFGMGMLEKKLLETDVFNVAYHPQIDTYNGTNNVQFVLADIRFE